MFKKKGLTRYEKMLLEGNAYLVVNRLNGKYTEPANVYSETEHENYVLAFNVTHPHVDYTPGSNYQRYARTFYTDSLYNYAQEGDPYYLVLKPNKRYPAQLDILACFPQGTVTLSPALESVLLRDKAYTGYYRSVKEEKAEQERLLPELLKQYEAERLKNETPEERAARMRQEQDDELFSEITNPVLTKMGLWFLMPLVLLSSLIIILGYVGLGLVFLFGCCLLYILAALLLIMLKKPLLARKRRKLGLEE